MTKYVCKRSDVYAGLLCYFDDDNVNKARMLRISRGILFTKDEEGRACDLVFDTDGNYPMNVLNLHDDNFYYVSNSIRLEELLKHLGYKENLTYGDVWRIYKKIVLHSNWLHHNRELFGMLKMSDGSYGEGGMETISSDIYNSLEYIDYALRNKGNLGRNNNKLIKKRRLVRL